MPRIFAARAFSSRTQLFAGSRTASVVSATPFVILSSRRQHVPVPQQRIRRPQAHASSDWRA
jgi:hypothetical protein